MDTLSVEQAAAALDGSEYGNEGSDVLFAAMKLAGLVAVFGASDDLMELRGAIYDEGYGDFYLTKDGPLVNECEDDDCPHFAKAKLKAAVIEPVWCGGDWDWSYKTTIPHKTFRVYEDGHEYCLGIVFSLSDIRVPE